MSASEQEFSESSNLESPQPQESPYSSPSQQVPQLANAFSGITCGDDITMHVDGKRPYLQIVVHPQDHFRFRYTSEMVGTHGCLLGKSGFPNKTRTHPTVELVNYTGQALIRVSLAHLDKDEEHPHRLLVDEQNNSDVCTVVPQQGSYKVGFAGMGIIHTAKKDVAGLLYKKYVHRMPHMSEKQLRTHCANAAKSINLNIVRLRFSAHDIESDKEICPPVFSEPIHNMKSAATNDLKICRISRADGRPRGGDDVFILVEKVNKKNIIIRFFELDEYGEEVWTANGNFLQSDVHHQYAIVFRTPPYRDPQSTKDVKVYIELMRPSDGRTSERKEFVYKAEKVFKCHKRRRVNSNQSSLESLSGSSIRSVNDVPITVEMIDKCQKTEVFPIMPAFQINIPEMPIVQAAEGEMSAENDLGDALLYGMASGVQARGMATPTCTSPSPMLGAPNVPEVPVFSLDSAELERLANNDPDLSAEDRRRFLEMDFSQIIETYTDIFDKPQGSSMDFIRPSMQLYADSGRGKGVVKKEPVSPSRSSGAGEDRKQNPVGKARHKTEYTAYYSAEEGTQVKQLVKEICQLIKTKTINKKQEVKSKLKRLFEMRLSNGDTFLHMALASNQPSLDYMIQLVHWMRLPELLNLTNDLQQTILHLAIIHDLPRLIPKLIQKGCNPMVKDKEGYNAVHYAVVCGACLEPLLEAIKHYDVECDLNDCNNERQTALHLAAVYDSGSQARLLVRHGASYAARDAFARTPLHLALYDRRHDAAAALASLTPPSDIDAVDGRGYTALQVACATDPISSEMLKIIKILLDKKADPFKQEVNNESAWRFAQRHSELRALFPAHRPHPAPCGDVTDDVDIKSEPEDEFESADEGESENGGLAGLSRYLSAVSAVVDGRGSWRTLAARLHADALLGWYENTRSPTRTLLTHLKESGDNVTSKSLMMHLQDMGEFEAAEIIRRYIQ